MNYRNTEMKLDQLVGYLNEDKINLSPAFQRGHVWSVRVRRKLLGNMIDGKPIPAVFLYKEAAGAKYSYNILDGKQRIESIILFVGNSRPGGLAITNWERYFVEKNYRSLGNFWIHFRGKKAKFDQLDEDIVRDVREYAIPTVEIQLDDDTSLNEIISLFVDINQQGVPVKRFDVVKAMYRDDPLLKSAFKLIAIHQRRGQDVLYRMVRNHFTSVLKRLQVVASLKDNNSKVDHMWERLLELILFALTKEHRKPVEVLKGFMSKRTAGKYKLTKDAERLLRRTFGFLQRTFATGPLSASRFAVDHTHFYSLATVLMNSDFLGTIAEADLAAKLETIARFVEQGSVPGLSRQVAKDLKGYIDLSKKQTTDVKKRQERERLLGQAIVAA